MNSFIWKEIEKTASGSRAMNWLRNIFLFNREVYSSGYHDACQYCVDIFKKNGIEAGIESFPADGITRYGRYIMPRAWKIKDGIVEVVQPEEIKGLVLAQYSRERCSLYSLCPPTPKEGIEAEVVLIDDLKKIKCVEGKIVLTSLLPRNITEAVAQAKGLAIISDYQAAIHGVREPGGLQDAVTWHFLWGRPFEVILPSFFISPKMGSLLRDLIRKKKKVKVKILVDSEIYNGKAENVVGLIPGKEKKEILLLAHLTEPGANDNASGCASLLEIAYCLQHLISKKIIPKPEIGIRFLLGAEFYQVVSNIENRPDKGANIVACLNLDMVGGSQDQGLNTISIGYPSKHLSPSFAPDFMARIFSEYSSNHILKWKKGNTVGDANILAGEPYKIPIVELCQYPEDKFYHTNLDTPDKISPGILKSVASICAYFTYFLASAGKKECLYLANEAYKNGLQRLSEKFQAKMEQLLVQGDEENWQKFESEVGLLKDREISAIKSIGRLIKEEEFRKVFIYLEQGIRDKVEKEYKNIHYLLGHIGMEPPALKEKGLTATRIANDLKKLGLQKGAVVMVHSSLNSLGYVEGGANTVIDGIIKAVGMTGTVIVPTHTIEGRTGCEGIFDHKTSPTIIGAIPEVFRLRKEAIRSQHPTHSASAIGKKAYEIVKDHHLTTAVGENSPVDKLIKMNGYILLLGVGLNSVTAIHWIEMKLVPSHQRQLDVRIYNKNMELETRHLSAQPVSSRWKGIDKMMVEFVNRNILKKGKVGNATCYLLRVRDMIKVIEKLYKKDDSIFEC